MRTLFHTTINGWVYWIPAYLGRPNAGSVTSPALESAIDIYSTHQYLFDSPTAAKKFAAQNSNLCKPLERYCNESGAAERKFDLYPPFGIPQFIFNFKWIFYRGAFLKSERRLFSKVAAVLMKTCWTSTSGFIFVREQVVYICSFEIFKWCKIEGSQRSLNMLLVRGTHHHLNNPLLHTHRWRLVLKETAWRQGGWS